MCVDAYSRIWVSVLKVVGQGGHGFGVIMVRPDGIATLRSPLYYCATCGQTCFHTHAFRHAVCIMYNNVKQSQNSCKV